MNKKILIFIILIISVFSFPDTIKIISPENNSENVDIKIIFRWDYAQNENIKYKVIISESSDFIKNTVLYENIYAKFFSGNIFKSETTYYIKIEAYRDNLLTGTSGTVKFKTRAYRYGDIIWNEFEKYDNIIPYYEGNQFLYINGNEIEIKDFDKKVIFRQKFDFKVTNAKIINDSIYIYEGKNLYIYDKEFHFSNVYFPDEIKEVLTPFNVVTKNGIYYFEDGKIKNKIDITDNKNIYFFKDKIYYMINSVFYVYDKTLTPEYSKTFDNITFNRIFFINSMDKIVLGNMKEIYFFEKNFDYVGKISFQNMNYNNYEVYDLIGNYGVVFDNKEINIFNGMFVKINQNALENDTQKIVGFNSEKYLVSGKLIKSIGIKNNPVWYYGSISSIQVISQPVVIKNGIFIGIKDYIDRFMIFYEETQTGNYWEGITTSEKNDNTLPDAETTPESSEVTLPDAEITPESSEVALPDAETTPESSEIVLPDAEVTPESSEVAVPDAEITPESSEIVLPDAETTPESSEVTLPETEMTQEEINLLITNKIDEITEPGNYKFMFNIPENVNFYEYELYNLKESTVSTGLFDENTISLNFSENTDYQLKIKYLYKEFKYEKEYVFKTSEIFFNNIYRKNYDEYAYDIEKYGNDIYMTGYKILDNIWFGELWKINEFGDKKEIFSFGSKEKNYFRNILITGNSTSTQFILTGDTFELGLKGDSLNVGVSPEGTLNFVVNYGDLGRDSGIKAVNYDDLNYISGGSIYKNNKLTDIFLSKYTNEGTRLWANTYGGKKVEMLSDIYKTSDQGIMGIGYTNSFGSGDFDIYAVKTDYYGTEKWSSTFGDENRDIPIGVFSDGRQRYIIYENSSDSINSYRIVGIDQEKGFDSHYTEIFSGENEKITGFKVFNEYIYLFGSKKENNKKVGLIKKFRYEDMLTANFGIEDYTYEDVNDFEITDIIPEEEYIYILGNTQINNIYNIILRKEVAI